MIRLFAVFACCLVATACAIPPPPTYTPMSLAVALDSSELRQELRVAEDGEIVFAQNVSAGRLAILKDAVNIDEFSASSRAFDVPAGSQLQVGQVYFEGARYAGFCTIDLTSQSKSLLGETYFSRSCFIDRDSDRKLDFVLQGGGRWQSVFENQRFDIRNHGLRQDLLMGGVELETPVSFLLSDELAPTVSEIFVYFYAHGDLGRFKTYADTNGTRNEVANGAIYLTGEFPETVEILGARLKILSIEDGAITYQVLNGMPDNRVFSTDLG